MNIIRIAKKTAILLAIVWLAPASQPASAQEPSDSSVAISTNERTTARSLSSHDRWRNYTADAFLSPGPVFGTVMPALGEQRRNEPLEFGEGWPGFGERLGRRVALYQLQAALYHSTAAALGTDTGYRRCGCGGAKRLAYTLSRSFLTRTDSGRTAPNLAYIGGVFGGAAIATETWYPDRYSALGDGARASSLQIGVNTAINVIQEFAPELKRLFRRR